jgi:RNA polymerase sigma factor for flagellar operon FliA
VNTLERNRMIESNLPLVGYLVAEVAGSSTHLSRDDLAAAGAAALVEIVDSYDTSRGVPFGSYARERIIGAIKDEMRRNDWAKRAARKQINDTVAVQETLTAALGRTPTIDEVAEALGVDRVTAAEGLAYASRTVSGLDEGTADTLRSDVLMPEESLLVAEQLAYARAAVAALPERMRYVIEQVYFHERSVTDLADELGVTHGAISQQRTEALRLMRDGMAAHYPDAPGKQQEPQARIAEHRRKDYLSRIGEQVRQGLTLEPALALSA